MDDTLAYADLLNIRKTLFGDGFAWEATAELDELVDSLMEMMN